MATTEQVEKIREHVEKVIAESKDLNMRISIPYPNVHSNMENIPFNVRTVIEDLTRLVSLLESLQKYRIEPLPDSIADSIITSLDSLYPIMDEIRGKDGTIEFRVVQIADAKYNNLVTQLHDRSEGIIHIVAPWLPYLAYAQGDVQKNIQRIAESVETARADEQEVARIINAVRKASAEASMVPFAKNFTKKARNLKLGAIFWLMAAAGLAVATGFFAIRFAHGWLLPTEEGSFLTQLLQVATTKLLVLGLLFTATVWCGRMYKATKHQAAVNEFRAIGLRTFEAFVEATDDAATRDAVLLETIRAIFAPAPTGLIDAKAGDSERGVRIVEVARDAARKATPAADDAG